MAPLASLIVFFLTLTKEKRSTLSMLFQSLAFTEIYSAPGVPQIRVTMRESVSAVPRSCAVIICTFSIPEFTGNFQARWKKIDSRTLQIHALIQYDHRNNKGEFNDHFNYSNQRAEFIGNPAKGDCSLIIKNIKKSDAGTYKFSVDINSVIPISTQRNCYSQFLLSVLVPVDGETILTGIPVTPHIFPYHPEDIPLHPLLQGHFIQNLRNSTVRPLRQCAEKPRISAHGNLIAGERTRLNCSIVHGCPGAKVQLKWVTTDEMGIAGSDTNEVEIVSEGPGIQAVSNVLTFTPSSAQHGKSLGCAVLAHGVQKAVENIILEIKHRPQEPTINSSVAAMEGSSVLLHCRSWGRPPVTLRWVKNGKIIGTSSTGELMHTIHGATSADDGEYWCLAENDVGTAIVSTNVSVHYQPKTEMACTNSLSVTNCTCRVKANPPARILWSVAGANFTELSPGLDVITWVTNGHVVQSSVTFPAANGMGNMISCSARNERGYHASDYRLHSGTYFRIIYPIVGVVGGGLVFLMAFLLAIKIRRERRGRCATHFQTQDDSPVYSAVVPRRKVVTDHLESCRLGSTQLTRNNENDEIIYAAINV